MTVTSTVRPGQVWCYRDDALALVTAVEGRSAYAKWVNGPRAGEQIHVLAGEFADSGDWTFNSENARLRCVDHQAALNAGKFLTDKGLRDVLVDGDVVSAPLTVMTVMMFAEDALDNGWAHDADCARMIGDLG